MPVGPTTFVILPVGGKGRINIKGAEMIKDEDGVIILDAEKTAVAYFPSHAITGVFNQASGNTTSRTRKPK